MIVEIRRYEIDPGRRDQFEKFFAVEVVPEMIKVGMRILGQFVSIENDTTFYYLRAFNDEAQRAKQTAEFYENPIWLNGLKERALDMETSWQVDVVRPALGSAIGRVT